MEAEEEEEEEEVLHLSAVLPQTLAMAEMEPSGQQQQLFSWTLEEFVPTKKKTLTNYDQWFSTHTLESHMDERFQKADERKHERKRERERERLWRVWGNERARERERERENIRVWEGCSIRIFLMQRLIF
jgi:hypothetical protein